EGGGPPEQAHLPRPGERRRLQPAVHDRRARLPPVQARVSVKRALPPSSAFAAVVLSMTVAQAAPPAPSGDKAVCLGSYESAQHERAERHLRAAREKLVTCGRAVCPAAMQRECVGWLTELDAATPTVVVRAKIAGGGDTADVRVVVDGEERATRL